MAEVTQDPAYGAGATSGSAFSARAGLAVQLGGAALSLTLLLGMGIWGYKLVMRDVNGIPVVRAMDGPMRQAPDNPGGELALHTGLAVNAVAGQGEAAPPEGTLVLAPPTSDLTEEDLLVQPTAEAGEYLPGDIPLAGPPAEPDPEPIVLSREGDELMSTEDILALADQIAAGSEPLSELSDTPIGSQDNPVAAAVGDAIAALEPAAPDAAGTEIEEIEEAPPQDASVTEALAPIPGEGLERALRPPARPSGLVSSSAATPPVRDPAEDQGFAVSTEAIPDGTVLVQLGAFDSVELAGGEWLDLASRFEEFMDGKERLIQVATSGGRDFFRLRATGFADLDDARRFCSALVAEDAPCIPVVARE